jgi:hypothetical protein
MSWVKRLVSVGLILGSSWLWSASNDDIYALQKTQIGQQEAFLNGMGAVKKLNTNYYIAALYLQEKSSIDSDIIYLETPKRLIIRFALDRVSARSFARELAGALKINNAPEELQAYRNDLRTFIGLFRGIYDKGDSLTFDYVPKQGVTVSHNGKVIGKINRIGFDKLLFKAWLGEKPLSMAFKRGLIGQNDDKIAIELAHKFVDLGAK